MYGTGYVFHDVHDVVSCELLCLIVWSVYSILHLFLQLLGLLPGIKGPLCCDGPVGQMYPWALPVLSRLLLLKLSYPGLFLLQPDCDAWSAQNRSVTAH